MLWLDIFGGKLRKFVMKETHRLALVSHAALQWLDVSLTPFRPRFWRPIQQNLEYHIFNITFITFPSSFYSSDKINKSVDLKQFRPRVLKSGVPSAEGGGRFPLFPTSSSVYRSKALPLTTDPREWGINGRAHWVVGGGGRCLSTHASALYIFTSMQESN